MVLSAEASRAMFFPPGCEAKDRLRSSATTCREGQDPKTPLSGHRNDRGIVARGGRIADALRAKRTCFRLSMDHKPRSVGLATINQKMANMPMNAGQPSRNQVRIERWNSSGSGVPAALAAAARRASRI